MKKEYIIRELELKSRAGYDIADIYVYQYFMLVEKNSDNRKETGNGEYKLYFTWSNF